MRATIDQRDTGTNRSQTAGLTRFFACSRVRSRRPASDRGRLRVQRAGDDGTSGRGRMSRMSRREFLALGAGAALGAAVSCTPGGTTKQAVAPPKPANTGVTETGPVTLTIWDQEQTGRVSRIWDQLNREFEQKYPNVTINRVRRGFRDLNTLRKLA